MHRLENVIQEYAWGSRTAIAELLGQTSPSPRPQAELWMGAHPAAPSRIADRALDQLISEAPSVWLGQRVAARFGRQLPFLFKVLAAAEPLSLQAHPTQRQAEAGFLADEAAGIPVSAPHRNYRDRQHKPELLCALTPFTALCGFRPVEQTLDLLGDLDVGDLDFVRERLAEHPNAAGTRRAFTALMTAGESLQERLVTATVEGCRRSGKHRPEFRWVERLAAKYPGDIGVVSSLLLNLVHLEPGAAIYLPAGNLHAYLEGVGVEIMASSDNVLRGGLTPKHVNVPELLRVLDFDPIEPPLVLAREANGERVYPTPAAEFQLSRLDLDHDDWTTAPTGPEILLCTEGQLQLRGGNDAMVLLPRGAAAFVPADTERYVLTGRGTIFRAVVPDH